MHKSDFNPEANLLSRVLKGLLLSVCLAFSIAFLPAQGDEHPPEWTTVFDPALAEAFEAQAQEHWVQAVEAYRAHLAKHPENKTALYNLTMVYLQLGQTREALGTSEKLLGLDRSESEAYILRAMVFEAMKELPKAKADYAKVIALKPGARQYRYRAAFWFAQGQYAKARGDFGAAIRLTSDVQEIYLE